MFAIVHFEQKSFFFFWRAAAAAAAAAVHPFPQNYYSGDPRVVQS